VGPIHPRRLFIPPKCNNFQKPKIQNFQKPKNRKQKIFKNSKILKCLCYYISMSKKDKSKLRVGLHRMCDGLVNAYTNLGVSGKDSRVHARVYSQVITEVDANNLYAGDPMARKLVDRIPYEGTRKWIELLGADTDLVNDYEIEFRRLDVINNFRKAWVLARLYGGAMILVNLDDGADLSEPVDYNRIDRVDSLVVFNRHEMKAGLDINSDIESPNFGMPNYYSLYSQRNNYEEAIHHTRLLRFDGSYLPTKAFVDNSYWHDSVLSSLKTPIINYSQAHDELASMMQSFRQQILKIEDLSSLMSMEGGEEFLRKRIELQDLMQSSLKTNIVDSRDDFSIISTPLTGISDAFEIINHRLVASTNMPHTIVLGDSPVGGLGNVGEMESRSWYDHVSDQQEDVLRDPVSNLLKMLSNANESDVYNPEDRVEFDFKPLWQLKDLDRAKMELDVAKKDDIYLKGNVLSSDEVRNSRFAKTHYSQETYIAGESVNNELEGNQSDNV